MISRFSQFLVEEEKICYWTFGRMNPPTVGHEKLLDKLASKAGKNTYRVFLSQSQDKKKNPLSYMDKIKFARKMFPKHARSIIANKKVKTFIEAAQSLEKEGFKKIVMVVGSDRVNQFDTVLKKYNKKDYNFESIQVVSAGERDPDADGAEGASATKQRDAAKENNFATFSQGLPKQFSNADAKKLFNAVRSGLGLKEQTEFHKHLDLGKKSDVREEYVSGSLFTEGDEVIIKSKNRKGVIAHLGSNYVIVESEGMKFRAWLEDVQVTEKPYLRTHHKLKNLKVPVNRSKGKIIDPKKKKDEATSSPQDPDIKDKDGTQPAAYYKGLDKKSTKSKRDAHFKKNAAKADDDPSAYKPAPGDATAKTKPSKHTKKFKAMFGESADAAIKKKAEKSGMPAGILRKVYNRGVAAWKGGHRPGTTPQQWGLARVNSFITKSSGTWGKADKDLAAKVRG